MMSTFIISVPHQLWQNDQIKEDENGGTCCSTLGRDDKCMQNFCFKT